MPAKKSNKKPVRKKSEEKKNWDKFIKRYHFVKEVAKDIATGIKNFGPIIAYVGTFGGAIFKGTMRFFGWDHPSIPGVGETEASLVVESPAPVARRSTSNEDTIGHGVETTEDQDDTVTLDSAPNNDYLMAQTAVPSYAHEEPHPLELGLYYVNHVFWFLCITAAIVYIARHIKIKFVKGK